MPGYKQLHKELDDLLYNYGIVKDCKIFERFLEYYFERISLAQFLAEKSKTSVKKVGDNIELTIDGDSFNNVNWELILSEFAEFLKELKEAKDPLLQHYQNICKDNPLIQKRDFNIKYELDNPNSKRGLAIKKLHDELLKFKISLANTNIIAITLLTVLNSDIPESMLNKNKTPISIYLPSGEFITFHMPEPHVYMRALNSLLLTRKDEACSSAYLTLHQFEELTNTVIYYVKGLATTRHSYVYSCLVEQSKKDPDISSLPTLQSNAVMYPPRKVQLAETPTPGNTEFKR